MRELSNRDMALCIDTQNSVSLLLLQACWQLHLPSYLELSSTLDIKSFSMRVLLMNCFATLVHNAGGFQTHMHATYMPDLAAIVASHSDLNCSGKPQMLSITCKLQSQYQTSPSSNWDTQCRPNTKPSLKAGSSIKSSWTQAHQHAHHSAVGCTT